MTKIELEKFKRMEISLKIIATWAGYYATHPGRESTTKTLLDIEKKAIEGLGRKK